MQAGEWLTRGTVWFALALYVASEVAAAVSRSRGPLATARWLNTLACLAFLAHVASAFHFYHGWSHSAAYAETARQTAEFSGWNLGGGLYLNYLFALVWLGEVMWAWFCRNSHSRPARWISGSVRGFFLFMIFNGAVVFVRGPMRWFGFFLCLALATSWWLQRKRIASVPTQSKPS